MAETVTGSRPTACCEGAATVVLPPELGSAGTACESTTLVVQDMHCGGCMRKVETALLAVAGVRTARANLSARRVRVTYVAGSTDAERLAGVLGGIGFPASELVAEPVAAAESHDRDLLRRLGVAGFAAANIMLLSVSVWAGIASDMGPAVQTLFHWLSALIALPAVAYAGQPFFQSAARALSRWRLNMDVPISLGVLLATGMSLYQTVRGTEQVYFDAAIMLLFFLLIGRFLDSRMRSRAVGAAANLAGLRAQSATVLDPDGSTHRIAARLVEVGQRILVAPGEHIAVDGRVRKGVSEVEESLITGETMPRGVAAGAEVHAGTSNISGPLVVEATATDERTLLAEITRLIEAAEQGRGRYVRLADRAARLYAPAVHVLGAATLIGWMLAGAGWEEALTIAVAVLIITCPCALALAVPAVQVAATGRLFGNGLIVKAPDGLERMAQIDTVVFDKTGTLSLGEMQLVDADAIRPRDLEAAAALAVTSRHPYSRAIVRAAEARGLTVRAAGDVSEIPGSGLQKGAGACEQRLGSAAWCGVESDAQESGVLWFRRAGAGAPLAFRFEDRLRPDAADVICRLQDIGLQVELVSGDRQAGVARAAEEVGLARHLGEQKPADKVARLDKLKADGRKVLMVGDGLNDAPALAGAHASVSPATAADISQSAADAVFLGDRLAPVVELIVVARAAHRMALQNFGIALGYNMVFVPLAVAGYVSPLIAAVAMSASSIAVTANAVRLRTRRLAGAITATAAKGSRS